MQKKQPPKELPPSSQNIMATILQSMPKEASITKIEYEGPRIALYTNAPRYLMENNELISNLVNVIKKRIVIRTDESIRKPEEDARKILDSLVPTDAGLEATFFDTATGEVSIEAKRPWLLQRDAKEFNHAEITEKIGWKLRIRKATTIPSRTIQTINSTLKQASTERSKQMKQVGDDIFMTYKPSGEKLSTIFVCYGKTDLGKDHEDEMINYNPEDDKKILCLMVNQDHVNKNTDIPFIRTLFKTGIHYEYQLVKRDELLFINSRTSEILNYFDCDY